MTRDFEKVAALSFPSDKVAAALASIDDAVGALRQPCAAPPLPPARLTPADRPAVVPAAAA